MVSEIKVVVLGDSNVGKTCLVARLVRKSFNACENATISASFTTKCLTTALTRLKLCICWAGKVLLSQRNAH